MKKYLLTLAALACVYVGTAQVKNVAYSPSFEEPTKGWYKVMQLSNGNTIYFNFNNEKGIEVTVYKPDHKVAAKKVLSSNVWEPKNMKNSTMEGIYEIAGQPVIFLQQLNDKTPMLFRIVLNPDNGAIVSQQKIGELPKYKMGAAYAMYYGGVDQEDFIVEKDPYSDAYAVVHYNSFAKESNERLELVHYGVEGGVHTELNRSYYDAQNFKYTTYIGMVVSGDKSVHMAAYGYNTPGSGGKDSRVIISRIRRGEKAFTNMNLEFTDDFKQTEGLMNYNPQTGMIQMLTLTYLEVDRKSPLFKKGSATSYYMALVSLIDPESLQIIKKTLLPAEGLMNYIQSKNLGEEFAGMPVNMILNSDNTSTILLEEKYESAINSVSTSVKFGRIGVITMDNTGKDVESYAIVKEQVATGHPMDLLYLAKRGKGLWSYVKRVGMSMYVPQDNRSFFSYDYINTANNSTYVIYNDNAENYEGGTVITNPAKMKSINNVSESVAVFRKVGNSKMESGYVFGRPTNDDYSSFCNVESADFNKQTGVYAVLMVKREKRDKKAYIAWVTFE